jgi:hypothetical protein
MRSCNSNTLVLEGEGRIDFAGRVYVRGASVNADGLTVDTEFADTSNVDGLTLRLSGDAERVNADGLPVDTVFADECNVDGSTLRLTGDAEGVNSDGLPLDAVLADKCSVDGSTLAVGDRLGERVKLRISITLHATTQQ